MMAAVATTASKSRPISNPRSPNRRLDRESTFIEMAAAGNPADPHDPGDDISVFIFEGSVNSDAPIARLDQTAPRRGPDGTRQIGSRPSGAEGSAYPA
jgi:hypothetical protein